MAFVIEQFKNPGTLAGSAPTVAMDADVKAGSHLMGMITWLDESVTLNSITDTRSNTYTLRNNPTDHGSTNMRGAMYYCENTSAGACTLTFNFSVDPGSSIYTSVTEVSGLASSSSLRDSNIRALADPGGSVDNIDGTAVTTVSGDFVICFARGNFSGNCTAGSAGTLIDGSIANSEWLTASGSSTLMEMSCAGSSHWHVGTMSFQPSGGGGGGSPGPSLVNVISPMRW